MIFHRSNRSNRPPRIAVLLALAHVVLTSAALADDQCLRFYEQDSFNGEQWVWCPGKPDPKLDFSNCVVAYEHANYRGRSWPFCPPRVGVPEPPVSQWNDKISSIKVPQGAYAKLCVDVEYQGSTAVGKTLCRSYFQDVPQIGATLNERFSFVRSGSINLDNFVMVVMSDPQYYFCVSDDCRNGPGNAIVANDWHSKSIERLAESTPNFAGIIVNGDITNTADADQFEHYRRDYEHKGFNLYIGLGNHDYDNHYYKWCSGDGNAGARNYCSRRLLNLLEAHVGSIASANFDLHKDTWSRSGSYAYSWDIGNYHFVQLQNYPAWTVDFSTYVSSRAGSEDFHITKSFDWLEKDLKATPKSRKVIINMHGMNSAMFNAGGATTPRAGKVRHQYSEHERSTTTVEDFARFLKILDDYPNVVAIFSGHLHARIGRSGQVRTPSGRRVPVYFSGSAEYNRYMKVTFQPDRLMVESIESDFGQVKPIARGSQTLRFKPEKPAD